MKFFSLCLFILSSFFAIAQTPVPEQDKQYLQQEEDENGYGCGEWTRRGPKKCIWYCRPPQTGDITLVVRCFGREVDCSTGEKSKNYFSCSGVGDTQQEAKAEAQDICNFYLQRKECVDISCQPVKVCFEVDYDADNRPMIRVVDW